MSKQFLCFAIAFVSIAYVYGGEIPNAVWRPGFYSAPEVIRLTPDGTKLTAVSYSDIKIIDLRTMTCTYIDDYRMNSRGLFEPQVPSRASAVTSTGEYFVTADTNGVVWWRRVSDTSVISRVELPRYKYVRVYLRNDTVAFISHEDSGFAVTLSGSVTKMKNAEVPIDVNDTLSAWVRDSVVYVVHRVSGDTSAILVGRYLGIDVAHRLYMDTDTVIIRYDVGAGLRSDTVMKRAFVPRPIIRNRFLSTRDTIVDLVDNSRFTALLYPDDILPNHTAIKFIEMKATLLHSKQGGAPDAYPVFEGPVTSVVQDPRDALTFIHTKSDWGPINFGYMGHIGVLTDTSLYLGAQRVAINFQEGRFINDSLTSSFATSGQTSLFGYVNLDRVRVHLDVGGVSFYQGFPDNSIRPTYSFSPTGDTLRSFKGFVDYGSCPTDTTIDSASGTTGFVPQTSYYVVGKNRYDTNDCDAHTTLQHPVISISPYRDRVLTMSDDRYLLTEVGDPTRLYASVNRAGAYYPIWADSGQTVRVIRGQTTIVSLHSDGSVDSIPVPLGRRPEARFRTTWYWSHDGCVVTAVSSDTLVSMDVRTGTILREYFKAPWLPYVYPAVYTTVCIGSVDGRILASLPNGCVATFPGFSLPVVSSVNYAQPRPLRPLQFHATRIEGATPHTHVTVYSLVGTSVLEGVADANGAFDIADRGLPHGAYVVVCRESDSIQSICVIQ